MIRYVRGYVRIRVSGRFAERFLNSCSHHKVRLWELKPLPEGYEMNLFLSGFRKNAAGHQKNGDPVRHYQTDRFSVLDLSIQETPFLLSRILFVYPGSLFPLFTYLGDRIFRKPDPYRRIAFEISGI